MYRKQIQTQSVSWTPNTYVPAGEYRDVNILGVTVTIASIATRNTTSGTFNLFEALNWIYVRQSSIPIFNPTS